MSDNESTSTIETEQPTGLENSGRRKAVKTFVGGACALAVYHTFPSKWGTPFIEQVFLPAHAATSGSSLNDPCSLTRVSGDTSTSTFVFTVDGFVLPPTSGLATEIVATPSGAGSPVTTNTTTDANGQFRQTMTITGGPGITSVGVVTTVTGASGAASCTINVPSPTTTVAPTTTGEATTEAPTTFPPSET